MFIINTSWRGYGVDYGVIDLFPFDTYIVTQEDLGKTLYKLLNDEVYKHENFALSVKRR